MVNMRAGLPRLGTVCDEYRLGDLEPGPGRCGVTFRSQRLCAVPRQAGQPLG